jgi:hypothetical protein
LKSFCQRCICENLSQNGKKVGCDAGMVGGFCTSLRR